MRWKESGDQIRTFFSFLLQQLFNLENSSVLNFFAIFQIPFRYMWRTRSGFQYMMWTKVWIQGLFSRRFRTSQWVRKFKCMYVIAISLVCFEEEERRSTDDDNYNNIKCMCDGLTQWQIHLVGCLKSSEGATTPLINYVGSFLSFTSVGFAMDGCL